MCKTMNSKALAAQKMVVNARFDQQNFRLQQRLRLAAEQSPPERPSRAHESVQAFNEDDVEMSAPALESSHGLIPRKMGRAFCSFPPRS